MYDLMVKTLSFVTITRGRRGRRFRFGVIHRSYGIECGTFTLYQLVGRYMVSMHRWCGIVYIDGMVCIDSMV
jgi:hypothetical protein